MKNKASARFYPGTERGHTDNQHFRSEYTFPFGSYQDAGKPAFGPLYLLNDETLAPEQQVRLQPEERTLVVVLPLSGAVDYRDTEANDTMLSAGSAGLFVLGAGSSYRLRNPYDAAVVHYLQLWFAWPEEAPPLAETIPVDLEKRNHLVEIRNCAGTGFWLLLATGLFDDGALARIPVGNSEGLFAFVVQGTFAMDEYRLEAGDGLALWNRPEAHFRALANDALLLLAVMGPVDAGPQS